MIPKAILFATQKHKGQKRIGGKPYISHPLAVAEMVQKKGYFEDYVIVALFHDLLEDTDATEEEIFSYGGKNVLEAVKLLTKPKICNMDEYTHNIAKNPLSKIVKLADRLHNLQSAIIASKSFRKRYIRETEDYYLDLAKGSVFEDEINESLTALKDSLCQNN